MSFTELMHEPELLNAIPVAVVVVGEDGRIVRHNSHWYGRMHWTVGDFFESAVHHEDKGRWENLLASARQMASAPQTLELRFIDRASKLLWGEVSCQCHGGQFYLTFIDRTVSRHKTIQMQADHRSATDLLHSLPALVYRGRINREWTMEFVSKGCEALTGYSAESIRDGINGTYGQHILPEYADYIWEGVQSALMLKAPYALTYRIHCANGEVKWVLEKGTGIFTDSGELLGIEGLILEIAPPSSAVQSSE